MCCSVCLTDMVRFIGNLFSFIVLQERKRETKTIYAHKQKVLRGKLVKNRKKLNFLKHQVQQPRQYRMGRD